MFCRLLVRLLFLAATLGTSATGRAAVLEVGPGLAFETLAAAQDHAAPGDTLRLAPGIHQDCLVVTRPGLTVEGSGPAQSSELRGLSTQCPSSGNQSSRLSIPRRCSAVNIPIPCSVGTRKSSSPWTTSVGVLKFCT